MTKVKICGLTRIVDIQIANELKPDYVGFVFAPSRRQITLEQGKELISILDEKIKKVGVFVNLSLAEVRNIAEQMRLDVVQLHGQESNDYIKELYEMLPKSTKIWRKIGISAEQRSVNATERRSTNEKSIPYADDPNMNDLKDKGSADTYFDAYLLDTVVKGQEGGTGIPFDWNLIKDLGKKHKIVLAGGLSSANVEKAIQLTHPYCVDVSTHVETDGFKDRNKIAEFIQKVRALKGHE